MEEFAWYDLFLESLYEKFPKRAKLAAALIDLLNIEREAVYRRLRKDVFFTTSEMIKIVTAFNISLDEITGVNNGLVPFQMQTLNYLDPSKIEYINFQNRVKLLEIVNSSNGSEYMEVSNRIPRPIYIGFLDLYRFEIFKWAYQYNSDNAFKSFAEVSISEKLCEGFAGYEKEVKNISISHFIIDRWVFKHLVNNIQYFHSILLVTDEEKALLKSQLHDLLEYFSKIAIYGVYPETQKKVNLYISQININTNYSYYFSEKVKSCRVHAFGKFDICSYDMDMINDFKTWMNLKKRSSVQISEVNEKNRIDFFKEQKEIIESL
jgi:hypothetical protein